MAETLRDLALAASQDPNNPAYQGPPSPAAMYGGGSAGPTVLPTVNGPAGGIGGQIPANTFFNPTPNQVGTFGNNVPPATAAPATAAGNVPTPGAPSPQSPQVAEGTPPGIAAPAATGADGAKPITAGGTGQGTSALDRYAKDSETVDKKREDAYDADIDSIKRQQGILQSGNQAASEARLRNEARFAASQSESQSRDRNLLADHKAILDRNDAEAEQQRINDQNPPNWFKEKGTAGSILAAISIAAGAFAAAMPHTGNNTNQALGIINGAIDRDTAAWKEKNAAAWKAIDYKGKREDQSFTENMFMAQRDDERKLKDYNHTENLIQSQLQETNNQAAIEGMQGLLTQVQLHKSDVQQSIFDRQLKVSQMKATMASAAANTPGTDAYNIKHAQEEAYKEQSDPKAFPNPRTAAEIYHDITHGGRSRPAGDSDKADFDSGVKDITTKGDEASKVSGIDALLGHLPAVITPESNINKALLDQYNNSLLPTAQHALGSVRSPELIRQMVESYQLKATDPESVNKAKVKAFAKDLRAAQKVGEGKKTTGEGTP